MYPKYNFRSRVKENILIFYYKENPMTFLTQVIVHEGTVQAKYKVSECRSSCYI